MPGELHEQIAWWATVDKVTKGSDMAEGLTLWTSLVAQMVKCLPTMWETQSPREVQLNLPESFNPWVGNISGRRKWQPTPVFLPGKSHGQRSLVGYSPWGREEWDMTERLHFHFSDFQLVGDSFNKLVHH